MADSLNPRYIEKLSIKANNNWYSFFSRWLLKRILKQTVRRGKSNLWFTGNYERSEANAAFLRKNCLLSVQETLKLTQGEPPARVGRVIRRLMKNTVKGTKVNDNPFKKLTAEAEQLIKNSNNNPTRANPDRNDTDPYAEKVMEDILDSAFRYYKRHPSHRKTNGSAYLNPPLEDLTKLIAEKGSNHMIQTYAQLVAKRFHDSTLGFYGAKGVIQAVQNSTLSGNQKRRMIRAMNYATNNPPAFPTFRERALDWVAARAFKYGPRK